MDNLFTNLAISDVVETRQRLSKLLQLHGYSACREALLLLEHHYTSSTGYDTMEEFITKINQVITFQIEAESSVIDESLAFKLVQNLSGKSSEKSSYQPVDVTEDDANIAEHPKQTNLNIKITNIDCRDDETKQENNDQKKSLYLESTSPEFNLHYNFLMKKLTSMPIFQGEFKITSLAELTASSQRSIRCICFGYLTKDISKIDEYILTDSSGRVPVRFTHDTIFRNRLLYSNCLVIIEGVYLNPDDMLFAANIGLPPILLASLSDKSLAHSEEKLIIVLKDLYLDDDDVCNSLKSLFTGYNLMEDPPILFILIGDFTRNSCVSFRKHEYKEHMRKLIKMIKSCDNLTGTHFVLVPGPNDSVLNIVDGEPSRELICDCKVPRRPMSNYYIPVEKCKNIFLATNPTHIYVGDRVITVVAQSHLKELKNNLIHDLSDHREEFYNTAKDMILTSGNLCAGVSRRFKHSMSIWQRPDLLVLADTVAFGNRYDYSSSSETDTTFTTVPSFSRQSSQFKVYYLKTGQVEDSQVSEEALEIINDATIEDEHVERDESSNYKIKEDTNELE